MSAAIRLDAIELSVEIDIAGEEADVLESDVRAAWSRCLSDHPGAEADVTFTVGVGLSPDDGIVTGDSRGEVMQALTEEITYEAVTAGAGELLMLHACVIAHPATGQAAVLVGPSGMGKTTLAAHLGRRWAYATDETAAIDAEGVLVPYPKPLSLVVPGEPKAQRSPDDLHLQKGDGTLRPKILLLLDRQRAVTDAQVEAIPLVEALSMLAEHTSYLSRLRQPLHRLAEVVQECGGLGRVTYSDTAQLEPLLEAALGVPE